VALVAPVVGTANVTFGIVFAVFVAALVVLVVITLRWAIRRDRRGRAEWEQRRTTSGGAASPRGRWRPPPSTNGRSPDPRASDPESAP
jgi:hypothetical protein